LEEIFKILDIKSGIRSPAEWAVSQMSEDDLRPQTNALMKYLEMDQGVITGNAKADIVRALNKKKG